MLDLMALGRTGVLAFQKALNVVGDNVANADTTGYVRRRAILTTQPMGRGGPLERVPLMGAGVRASALVRDVDALKQNAARVASGDQMRFAARLEWLERLEALATSAEVAERVGAFFNAATDLAAAPTQVAARTLFLAAADDAAGALASHGTELAQLSADVDAETRLSTRRVNDIAASLVKVNEQLRRGDEGDGSFANVMDTRDRLLAELADEARITVEEGDRGVVTVKLGFGPAAVTLVPRAGNAARIGVSPDGQVVWLNPEFTPEPLRLPASGRLAGLIEARGRIEQARAALDGTATQFAALANDWHTGGVDANGQPGEPLFGTIAIATVAGRANRSAAPVDVTLADGAVPDPSGYRLIVEAGGITLTRRDNSASVTGAGPLLVLDGLTVRIGGGAAIGDQWLMDGVSGARGLGLRPLVASDVAAGQPWLVDGRPGNAARTLPTIQRDASALALPGGDVTPPPWQIRAITGGLAEVYDPTGATLLATVPADGSLIEGPGVRFTVPADARDGDVFRITPTPAGAADNRNALDLAARRVMPGPNGTVEGRLDADLADVGAAVADSRRLENAAALLKDDAARANAAISGVDLEREAAELTRLQAAYRANAQILGVARDLFNEILGLTR